jgi:CheY-like chemotaxis protein
MSKKILIIEDEQILADLYKFKLESEGYAVILAYDGEAGLAMAEKEQPDLVLLDLLMPKLDGYKVLERLKKNEKTEKIKVWVMTNLTHNSEDEKKFLSKADANFIKANITPSQLFEKIKLAFEK